MNEIVKLEVPELKGLEKSKAEQIRNTFVPMAKMLSDFEDRYKELMSIPIEEMTKELCKEYKRFRLDVSKVRIDTGKAKDKAKEYLKLEDKAIMGVHNILVYSVKEMEDNAKERENYFEIQERKRLEALQIERVEELSKYVEDAEERNLSGMDNDVWNAYLSTKRKEYEDRIAAEKKAEEDRIAKDKEEKAEQERIRKENERLRKEAEVAEAKRIKEEKERQRLAKIESDKLEAEKKEQERVRLENEAKAKAELEKVEAEKQRLIAIEKAKTDKLAKELEAKKQAEIKAEEDKMAEIESNAKKGDSAKVNDLINDLKIIKTKYIFKSNKNQKMYSDVSILIDKLINHIEK